MTLLLVATVQACGPAGVDEGRAARSASLLRLASRSGPLAGQPDASGRRWVQVYLVLDGPSVIDSLAPPHSGAVAVLGAPDVVAASRDRLQAIAAQQQALRPQLVRLEARVTGTLRRVANALQVDVPVDRLDELRRLPGVRRIAPVTLFRVGNATAVPLIGAPALWSADVPLRGEGVRLGIIDSGVDYTHATFGGPGQASAYSSNDPLVVEPGSFPTERVDGVDLVGDAYDPEDPDLREPVPDGDPLDCEFIGHGTHVAAIAAGGGARSNGAPYGGPYEMSLDPSGFAVAPGVAPRAQIYALKVTGCGGSSSHIALALEWAADPDGDGDLSDRLDVVNLSMGASFGWVSGEELEMAAALIRAGCVFVAAAGNDGNAYAPFFTLSGPSSLTEAISVAASLDSESRFLALGYEAPGGAGQMPAVEAAFSMPLAQTGPVSAELVLVEPELGCSALQNAAALDGQIALVRRGECTFLDKFRSAAQAGAVAVVVADNSERDTPWEMAGNGFSALPGVLVRRADGERLVAQLALGAVTVTLDAAAEYPLTVGPDYLAEFSSRGPAATHGLLKPDLAAPGVGITSALVASGFRGVDQSGTSMASPMAAGAAALVRQAHPEYFPGQVKAAMMNSARSVHTLDGVSFPTSMAGAGRVDVAAAATLDVLARAEEPAGAISVNFGAIVAAGPLSESRAILVDNRGDAAVTLQTALEPDRELPGVSLALEPATLTLAPGESGKTMLSLTIDPRVLGRPDPDALTPATGVGGVHRHYLVEASGKVRFEHGAVGEAPVSRVPYHAVLRAAAERRAGEPTGCAARPDAVGVSVPLEGPSAHPEPVVSAFQLLFEQPGGSGPDAEDPQRNVLAVGVATDRASAGSTGQATAYFGVAVEGDWITPSAADWSMISLLVDTDLDGEPEYFVDTRAQLPGGMGGAPAFCDAPVVRVIDLEAWETTLDDGVLDMVRRDVVDTQPYFNRVLVLPVPLYSLGLSDGDAEIAVAALAGVDYLHGNEPVYTTVDLEALAVDTARFGLEGQDRLGNPVRLPLFKGDEVTLRVEPDVSADALPRLLLLHHTNAALRFETVALPELSTLGGGNLSVVATPGGDARAGAEFEVHLDVRNEGAAAREDVRLEAAVSGAAVVGIGAETGSCDLAGGARCTLGTLAAEASARVTLTLSAPDALSDTTAVVVASVSAASTCETDPDDNTASATITVEGAGPPRRVEDSRGCGAAGQASGLLGWLLLGLALGLVRRRRPAAFTAGTRPGRSR